MDAVKGVPMLPPKGNTQGKGKSGKKGSKRSAPMRSRSLMYVQQTKYLANRFRNEQDVTEHLKKHFGDAEWAFIIHDKDIENGLPVESHIHIAFSFDNPRMPSAVARMMGEPDGDNGKTVEVFKGRYAKNNMFAYLVHATAMAIEEGKHRYSETEVISNFDYIKYMEGVKVTAEQSKLSLDEIRPRIMSGDMILKDFFRDGALGTAEALAGFYADNKNKINNYIESRYTIQMSSKGGTDLEIIYIQGGAGSGKTVLAKEYAERKYGDYFITGSSNDAVQDYMGEPVAIFDDARPTDFNASDWLKMLDPYNNKSSVTSRYYNKYLSVKCIILTTTTPFEEFFVYAKDKGAVDEPVSQFMRRFQLVIDVKPDEDAFGNKYAVGQLYGIERLPQVQTLMVGNSYVSYEHGLRKEDGKIIRVEIPQVDTSTIADDVMKFFS